MGRANVWDAAIRYVTQLQHPCMYDLFIAVKKHPQHTTVVRRLRSTLQQVFD